MAEYIPVLILLGFGIFFGVLVMAVSAFFGPTRPNRLKMGVYECGVPPAGDARRRVSVKFYLVAILFLLFDVESVFFFPWAMVFKRYLAINSFILWEMFFFVGILLAGYFYVLKKDVFDWD